ncbi:MAG: hypothetical protein WC881_06700 [Elusimicrobiota bacterium]|jgi:hypothetical protein
MIGRLFHALLASSVVVGTAIAGSYGVTHWLPEGRTRDLAERWVAAPGEAIYQRLEENPQLEKLKDAADKKVEAGKEKLDRFNDTRLGREMLKATASTRGRTRRLMHIYNVGAWAGIGFAICLIMTLIFGISTIKTALALGFKVALTLIFLQAALVLGGVLAFHKLAG